MVRICKPFFHIDKETRGFKNLMGKTCSVMYSSPRGSMVKIEDENIQVFVPKDALENVKN